MTHYFETPERPLLLGPEFQANIFGRELRFASAKAVFSGTRLDLGTSVLLREAPAPTGGTILDLGCGAGTIAVGLAAASEAVQVCAIDVNDHALQLTAHNARLNHLESRISVQRPDEPSDQLEFDEIWSNPPIRIGKPALHELLLHWLPRLKPTGTAYLVVGKNLGGDSLQRWLEEQGYPTQRLASAKGFRVLRTTKSNSTEQSTES